MSLTIRPVDPWDEDEMDVLQALYVEAQRAEVPDARVYSRADSVALLRRTEGGVFYHAFAGFDGRRTEMVGQTWVVGSTIDNLHLAHLWAWVPPRFGRRGHGTALVEVAEQHLRELGRRTAVTPDLDRRRHRRLPAVRRAARLLPGPDAGRAPPAAADGRGDPRPAGGGGRRATARATRCAPSLGPIPDDLVPGFLDPLQPDERRDAHRRHRARGGPPYPRGAGRSRRTSSATRAAPG